MNKQLAAIVTAPLVLLAVVLLAGCNDSNPISAFQPEIVNNQDAFEFQITAATDVSTTLNYSWLNTGTSATIDHSTATVDGSAAVTIRDAKGVQVYTDALKPNRVEPTSVGAAGA